MVVLIIRAERYMRQAHKVYTLGINYLSELSVYLFRNNRLIYAIYEYFRENT